VQDPILEAGNTRQEADMQNKIMLGMWRYMLNVPPFLLEKQRAKGKEKIAANLAFITPEHRRVHHFVVRQLPFSDKPLAPIAIARALDLPIDRVNGLLNDLQEHMTFLFRNSRGDVVWAYPVTVEPTPHHVTFNTGEQVYAAWAADAFATPFVQGRLRNEQLSVTVNTACAHCGKPMKLKIDSDLSCKTEDDGCAPIIFLPDVDLIGLADESIIQSFWQESVFFWSEEHAREYRRSTHRLRGIYMTVTQLCEVTRIMQSVLFGFE
jgi:hypothetical protein